MQTPTRGPQDDVPVVSHAPKPTRYEQDLIVIPEAHRPWRRGAVAAIVAGVVAAILLVALGLYAIDQRDRANETDAQLTVALADQRVLVDTATASRERIVALETRIDVLEGDVQRARRGRDVVKASREEARNNLREARSALQEEQARFRSYMGPVIGDGSHVGRLIAVGSDQSPARVTTDLGRWFQGPGATHAAIEDGVIPPGGFRPRYFRNDDVTWRTLPLDPFATVTVLRWGRRGTYQISLGELQRLSRAESRRADRIGNDPFRITVADGRVIALRQLRYP